MSFFTPSCFFAQNEQHAVSSFRVFPLSEPPRFKCFSRTLRTESGRSARGIFRSLAVLPPYPCRETQMCGLAADLRCFSRDLVDLLGSALPPATARKRPRLSFLSSVLILSRCKANARFSRAERRHSIYTAKNDPKKHTIDLSAASVC